MTVVHYAGWIILSLGLVPYGQAPDWRVPPAGCSPCDVRFDLALDKPAYETGEPIVLKIHLTNLGSTPVQMPSTSDVTGRHDGYAFEVRDAQGSKLPSPGDVSVSLLKSLGSTRSIPSNGSHVRELTLNDRVPPLTPGKYFVRGTFAPRYRGQDVRAESQELPFEIVETPPAQLQKRISDLTRDVNLRADPRRLARLLGFTGDPSALALLVEMLYAAEDNARTAAVDALLYFDPATVRQSLLESLRTRGPRDRMVHFLVVWLRADKTQVTPLLLRWLADQDADTRAAAVEGLRLGNRPPDPKLFAPLAAMLEDPVTRVRHVAVGAVGGYQDAAALEAVKAVLDDPAMREQAVNAVGWVAGASSGTTRDDAIRILQSVRQSGGRAGQSAASWLARIGR